MKTRDIISGLLIVASVLVLSQLSKLTAAPSGLTLAYTNVPWSVVVAVIAVLGIIYSRKYIKRK